MEAPRPFRARLRRLALGLGLLILSPLRAEPSWTAVPLGTDGSPRGYWEFLPSSYAGSPDRHYPVVFYFHGLGEIGDGSLAALNKVLANEVARNLNKPDDPIRALLDQREVVVLCPQYTTWWASAPIRAFIDHAKTRYRIDPRRVYLTGLSAGSQGVTEFMNNDADADEAAAFLVCAYRGTVAEAAAARLAPVVPFWILTARGDWSNAPDTAVDRFAAVRAGGPVPTCMANFPAPADTTANYTGRFTGSWLWSGGLDPAADGQPKLTVFAGGSHNSWQATYTNPKTWTWLLAHQKPDLAITSPADGLVLSPGRPLRLAAAATDSQGAAIAGSGLRWSSQLSGSLGTGASLDVASLGTGRHVITCQAVDGRFHGVRATVSVTVPHPGPFLCNFDFGSSASGFPTTAAGWNNITDPLPGAAGARVGNAVSSEGLPVGVRVEITRRFDSPNTNGLAASPLFPATAQSDSLYISDAHPVAQVLISGLNPGQLYDLACFASRATAGNRITYYTVNGRTASLDASDNTTRIAALNDLAADSAGTLALTVTKDAGASYGYLGVMTLRTAGPPPAPLPAWRSLHGLAADGSDDLAAPAGDGVPNLLKFAFNLAPNAGDLARPSARQLSPDGSGGLPFARIAADGRLAITFVRRKDAADSGLRYSPEVASDPAGSWAVLDTPPAIAPIDSVWERVTCADTGLPAPRRFLRVRVSLGGSEPPAPPAPIVVDNADSARVAITGAWTASTYHSGYYGSNYLHDGNSGKGAKSIRFTPDLPAAGDYQVSLRWIAGADRAAGVPVTITHADGSSAVAVDQRANGGVWAPLGTWRFAAGSAGGVLVSTTDTTGYVVVDAVMFESK